MPLYNFESSEFGETPRLLGLLQLSNDEEAWEEAIIACGERIKDVGGRMPMGGELVMIVADEARAPIFTIKISTEAHKREL